jgi:hypothetical protein
MDRTSDESVAAGDETLAVQCVDAGGHRLPFLCPRLIALACSIWALNVAFRFFPRFLALLWPRTFVAILDRRATGGCFVEMQDE